MSRVAKISRRDFVAAGVAAAGGLVLGVRLPGDAPRGRFQPSAFVQVTPDDEVVIWVAKSEMGQGVWTSLPAIVADEMDADWERVRILQADAHPRYGSQLTGGSTSVSTSWQPLRRAGAAAREMLVAAARFHLYRGRGSRVLQRRTGQYAG